MSIHDIETLLRELIARFDSSIDTSPGSRADVEVVQPMLRRLGPDPFSMDVRAFIYDRLNQEYPELATRDGDAVADLLVKPLELLLDPVVREHQRIRQNLSFRDPALMTIDEAEALGGNYFSPRRKGDYARGTVRLSFAQPQSISVTSSNYCTSRGGLAFFPEGTQEITVEEMLFNVSEDLYYFDINVVAERAGEQYNIEPGEIVAIANLPAAVKVTNRRRFRGGIAAESAIEYIERLRQEMGEKSMVTKRGIVRRLMEDFPEMTRLNVTGFNDPEMQRDVVRGGGLGQVRASGLRGFSVSDGEARARSRRLCSSPMDGVVDFTAIIGPPGSSGRGFFVCLQGDFLPPPFVKDIEVRRVVDETTLDLEESVFPLSQTGIVWSLRKRELTLSGIPGGILFPDSPNGTVTIPDDQIHVGGATDVYLRGRTPDTGSLVLEGLSDDSPVLSGTRLESDGAGRLTLRDFVLSENYAEGDSVWSAVEDAVERFYVLQVLTGVGVGTYRIESAAPQVVGASPSFVVSPPVPPAFDKARWRLVDDIDVDLNEPKETKIQGGDLQTIQASNVVTTTAGVNFEELGVAVGDTLRVLSGPDVGDYTVRKIAFPFFTRLELDRPLTSTRPNIRYRIFRSSAEGGVSLPLLRVTGVELLDTNKQPIGSKIPYAKPIGAVASSFANVAHGVKLDLASASLGIVGPSLPGGAAVAGKVLQLRSAGDSLPPYTFTGTNPVPLSSPPTADHPNGGIVEQINAYTTAAGLGPVAHVVGAQQLGLAPVAGKLEVIGGATAATSAIPELFGSAGIPPGALLYLASDMVRASDFQARPLKELISPPLDMSYDVLQVVSGRQAGTYSLSYAHPYDAPVPPVPSGLTRPPCIAVTEQLSPEASVHVQVGARSLGKARLFFLDPTTFEADEHTTFTARLSNGAVLRFRPDPALASQVLPALPAGAKPHDGEVSLAGGATTLRTTTTNFVRKGVRKGDILEIDFVPLVGTEVLPDVVAGLAFTTLDLRFEDGTVRTVTFVRDSTAVPQGVVSRSSVASQINSAVGKNICRITPTHRLEFDAEVLLFVQTTGTANTLLGFSTSAAQSNRSANAGRYEVQRVLEEHAIEVAPALQSDETRMQFRVLRPGTQRIGATTMSTQVGPAGLYYADIELVSEGTGDQYNLEAGTPLEVEGYRSDGYYLTTEDENLSFSPAERIHLHLTPTFNEVGTDDSPEEATNLLWQNIQINYEHSPLVSGVQDFLQSDLERVVCSSPLARYLVPHYIRFDLRYAGGPKESEVLPEIQRLIQATFPDQQISVTDITSILSLRGATNIETPLTLYGIIYNQDRSISLEMSQDSINVGRLAAFIPERIQLHRSLQRLSR